MARVGSRAKRAGRDSGAVRHARAAGARPQRNPTPGPAAARPAQRRARRRLPAWTGTAAGIAGPALLIGVLAWPLLFTSATFNEDWINHLWYMWHESRALQAHGLPSLFLNYSEGVFYPYYAFYGATLYALTGALALALGQAPVAAYVLTYLAGFATAYAGWLWLAHQFGVRGWTAHAPGVVFVTSAYYLTMIYGLGDWPEFLAVSAMVAMIAAGLSVLRGPRLRAGPAAALALSTAIFFGSHVLSAIWGTTVLLVMAVMVLGCAPGARRMVGYAGALRALAVMFPALLLSAWFLLPAAAYEAQTVIAHSYPQFRRLLRADDYTVAARHLFTLSRARASGTIVTTALPVPAIAWVLGSAAILFVEGRRGAWMRALLLFGAATTVLLVLMTHPGLLLALPRVYATVQFGFRLESYVLMGVSAMVLAALVLARQDEGGGASSHNTGNGNGLGQAMRRWQLLLVPVALASAIGGVAQVDAYTPDKSRATVGRSYMSPIFAREGLLDYVDDDLPILRQTLPHANFALTAATAARATVTVDLRRGRRVDTNLRAIPSLVHVTGARIVGTDSSADDVLEVEVPVTGAGAASRSGTAPHAGTAPTSLRPGTAPHAGTAPAHLRAGASPAPSHPTSATFPSHAGAAGAPAGVVLVTVTPAASAPVVVGRVLSALALAALAVGLGALAVRDLREARRGARSGIGRSQGKLG
jgi:hypothetical protein